MEISVNEIIGLCGGASTIVAGVVGYFAQRIANRQNERWRLQTETDLKRLDSKLSEKSSLLNNLIDVQKSNYSFSQEKRISSIEKAWGGLENIKDKIPSSIEFLFDSMGEEEIEALNNPHTKNKFLIIDSLQSINYNNFYSESKAFTRILFAERPFLGEELWTSLTVYSKFLDRLVYLVQIGIANKSLKHFKHDAGLIEMLKLNFPPHQITAILQSPLNSLNVMCFLNENKIVEQINDVISGEIASSNSFQHIQQLKEMIKRIDIEKTTNY